MPASSSSNARPKTSGALCRWKSMRPSTGLTAGGGGGKARTCASALLERIIA